MRATDLKNLLEVVESVRNERHPGLSTEFVREVVLVEEQGGEDDAATLRALSERLERITSIDEGDGGG